MVASNVSASNNSRTVVPVGLNPVAQARAELKAALAAIEEKANVPKRMGVAVDTYVTSGQKLAKERPAAALALAIAGAAAIGFVVWGAVRIYTR